MSKLVFYELNEVPYRVLEAYCTRHPESHLAHLLEMGDRYETYSEDEGVLSPWITWPTLHRGITNEKHLISDFGQDLEELNNEYPVYTELLAGAGVKVGVFGSLHTYPLPKHPDSYSFFVPDTFANGSECHPQNLEPFQKFNLKMVDKSGRNVAGGLSGGDAISFMSKLPALGVTVPTLMRLGEQVISEVSQPVRKVRRRTSQTQIAFDIFYKQLCKTMPDFSSFFTNHVASSMHRYWPGLFPDDYTSTDFDKDWLDLYAGEIEFTLKTADQQLGKLRRFVEKNRDYRLVVLSSMGQAAVDGVDIVRKQLLITDRAKFMNYFGVDVGSWEIRRAMSPRFIFRVSSDSLFRQAKSKIEQLQVNGEPVELTVHEHGVFVVKLGQQNLELDDIRITDSGRDVTLAELGLENIEIQDATGSYAYHVPNGSFVVYNPNKRSASTGEMIDSISTIEIAPSVLQNFGVPRNEYMDSSSAIMFN